MKSLYLLSAGIALTLTACSHDDDHLSQGKMVDVVTDMQLADAYASNHVEFASDSARNVLRMSVLKKHGVTQEEYDRTLDWYAHNLENYTKLYDEVEKRLDKRQNKLLASSNDEAAEASGSIWPYPAMAMISALSSQDAIQFSIPVSEFAPGERVTWMMRLTEQIPSRMVLGVDYTDGTTAYTMKRSTQKRLELTLQSDSTLTVNRVYGYMIPDNSARLPVWADSISLKHQPLAKETYHMIRQQTHYKGTQRSQPKDTARRLTIKPIKEPDDNVKEPDDNGMSMPRPGTSSEQAKILKQLR